MYAIIKAQKDISLQKMFDVNILSRLGLKAASFDKGKSLGGKAYDALFKDDRRKRKVNSDVQFTKRNLIPQRGYNLRRQLQGRMNPNA